MALAGLVGYGSDDESEASLAGSGDAGVVLLGEYAAKGDDAQSAQLPAHLDAHANAAPSVPMDIDPSGASPAAVSQAGDASRDDIAGSEAAADAAQLGLPADILRPPPGICEPHIQEKVSKFLNIQRNQGRQIKNELRRSRDYRNPDFLQKMVAHSNIMEAGSNLPAEVFDPKNLHPEDFAKAMSQAWRAEAARRGEERKAGGGVEFTSGSAAKPPASSGLGRDRGGVLPAGSSSMQSVMQKAKAQAAAVMAKQKGSRWDNKR